MLATYTPRPVMVKNALSMSFLALNVLENDGTMSPMSSFGLIHSGLLPIGCRSLLLFGSSSPDRALRDLSV